MAYYDELVFEGFYEAVEVLVVNQVISLDDLSEEAFAIFKQWIEG